jgi:excisionase family DNA binding protein
MSEQPDPTIDLLTPSDVAAVLFVDPKTVTRWATAGKLPAVRTPGGHRRFLRSDVMSLLDGLRTDPAQRTVPRLASTAPGSAAASAAAVIADAVAIALEAQADAAAQALQDATSALEAAAARAAETQTKAHEGRRLAAAFEAHAASSG